MLVCECGLIHSGGLTTERNILSNEKPKEDFMATFFDVPIKPEEDLAAIKKEKENLRYTDRCVIFKMVNNVRETI
jgi:hypothetical protein